MSKHTPVRLRTLALLSGASFCWAMGGMAAQAQSTTTSEASLDVTLDEIIVTAQRRSQSLQDVPVTVTTFGDEEIKNARLQQVDDIAMRTPGLSFDAFPATQPRLAIRGIGSSDRGAAGDPSTAVFLDETYLGRPAAIAFDLFDVERIEVLKGPQGTLYGRNVVGGAINVITAAPEVDAFDASAEATYGNYNRVDAAAFVNVPVATDVAAIRASGAWRQHDGYTDNNYTGGELDDQDTKSIRLQALVRPSENLSVRLGFDGTRDRANGPGQHVVALDNSDPLSGFWTVDQNRDYNSAETDGYQNRDTWGLRGEVNWDMSFATLNYLLSYRDLEYDAAYDFDGGNPTANVISIGGGNIEDSELFSHELRLMSPESSDISWVVGLYQYTADTVRQDRLELAIGGPTGTEIFAQHAELDSVAAYADVTVPVSDKLNLIGGIRYTKDKKTFNITTTESNSFFRVDGPFDVTAEESWGAVTWRLGADYHLNDNHMVYAMVSRGFKSGGFQDTPGSAAEATDSFNPEYATQYEIGLKSQFFGRRLTWNNTVFQMDYTDLQTRQVNGLIITTNNAGEATIKGYETDLMWRSANGLGLNASYAYLDATFDVFVENGVDLTGNRISRTPKHKLVVTPSYAYTFNSGADLTMAVDYAYTSKIFDDNSNRGPERRAPTVFVDARLVYTSSEGDWAVSVWGKNLTNEVTRTHQATFLGGTFAAYNPPRTYGVTLRWNY
ncbi:TonB-dependent receptor [Kordiimonas aestuarii]|uniref:TonB-dependent receptor n=1 Tax=Kordiimonas aestuarii TaxID=1005925 RepID=UPI0021CFFB7F|nr:TonB-dependent receptor [Kordiimonas aestuarii]